MSSNGLGMEISTSILCSRYSSPTNWTCAEFCAKWADIENCFVTNCRKVARILLQISVLVSRFAFWTFIWKHLIIQKLKKQEEDSVTPRGFRIVDFVTNCLYTPPLFTNRKCIPLSPRIRWAVPLTVCIRNKIIQSTPMYFSTNPESPTQPSRRPTRGSSPEL